MRTQLYLIGKTDFAYLREGIALYEKRLKNYLRYESKVIHNAKHPKSATPDQMREREGDAILKQLDPGDYLVLLDERSKAMTSPQLADWVEQRRMAAPRRLVFVVGGAYGFSDAVYRRADAQLSLSKMTFSHQMIRLFFVEQLYRAMTILAGEPYHHQ